MKIFTDKTLPKILPKTYVEVCSDPFCERCGGLEPYDPVICFDEGAIKWCMTCNSAGEHESINDRDAEKIFDLVIKAKTEYFEKELSLLKTLKINDVVPV